MLLKLPSDLSLEGFCSFDLDLYTFTAMQVNCPKKAAQTLHWQTPQHCIQIVCSDLTPATVLPPTFVFDFNNLAAAHIHQPTALRRRQALPRG